MTEKTASSCPSKTDPVVGHYASHPSGGMRMSLDEIMNVGVTDAASMQAELALLRRLAGAAKNLMASMVNSDAAEMDRDSEALNDYLYQYDAFRAKASVLPRLHVSDRMPPGVVAVVQKGEAVDFIGPNGMRSTHIMKEPFVGTILLADTPNANGVVFPKETLEEMVKCQSQPGHLVHKKFTSGESKDQK